MPFVFIAPKTLNYSVFQSFDFERTLWRLFQKHAVYTKLDIYVFITERNIHLLQQLVDLE